MPDSYTMRVDSFAIGAHSPACGLAVHTRSPVITPDLLKEPLSVSWVELAIEYDFRGCWSFPIHTVTAKAVGTFPSSIG